MIMAIVLSIIILSICCTIFNISNSSNPGSIK